MERRLRIFTPFFALFLTLGLTACDSGGGGGDSSSSSLSISGSLSTGVSSSSLGMYDVGAMDGACSDGNHYQVYCVTFDDSPVAATGSVVCNGASSGNYTVSGIPKNTAFGCFVRSSTDGASFKTVGTIEVPATGALGDSDQIVAGGDMGINITINSDGSIDAAVTTDNRVDTSSSFTDASTFNGVYKLTCESTAGGDVYSLSACKCFLGEDDYGSDYNNQDECLADGGAKLATTVSLYVDMNIYDATANSDISDNGTVVINAGDRVQGITVWAASGSGSTRTGGEGLGDFATNMGLTWTDVGGFQSQATNAITWSSTIDVDSGGASTSVPGGFTSLLGAWSNKTVGEWMTQIKALIDASQTAGDYDCGSNHWGGSSPTNFEDDAGCVSDFLRTLEDDETITFPRMWAEPVCDENGCNNDPDTMRLWVEGIEFNYSFQPTEVVANVTTETDGSEGPSPRSRYVFEQWHPMPGGGGGFKDRHDDRRWYRCDTAAGSGIEVVHASCDGGSNHDGLECFEEEELAIRMIPATGGNFNVVFESRTVVYGGQFHLEGETDPVFSNAATDLCKSKAFQEWSFMASGVKQP